MRSDRRDQSRDISERVITVGHSARFEKQATLNNLGSGRSIPTQKQLVDWRVWVWVTGEVAAWIIDPGSISQVATCWFETASRSSGRKVIPPCVSLEMLSDGCQLLQLPSPFFFWDAGQGRCMLMCLLHCLFIILIFFNHFKEQIMYNVYLISISYIYLPHFILLYIYRNYMSQRQTTFQFIM